MAVSGNVEIESAPKRRLSCDECGYEPGQAGVQRSLVIVTTAPQG